MAHARTTLIFIAPLLLASLHAEAQTLRYTTTAPGGIVATGNTLGLSKAAGVNGPGTLGSIGTFISLDPADMDLSPIAGTPWGANTTNLWMDNGSRAVLTLPARAEVLYAELMWGGSHSYATDVSAFINDAVTLSVGGATFSASPDGVTAMTITRDAPPADFRTYYYMRSADVTSFVQQHGAATYAVSGVPATEDTAIDSLNAAGWTLIVAYRNGSEPIRNLSVFVGGTFVDEDATVDYELDGFCAPPSGVVEGRVVVSAIEGDANLEGDELAIAPDTGSAFEPLFGDNNRFDNFFGSQINGRDGLIDTSGSFGNVNHDAITPALVVGARQGWDITTVGISSLDDQLFNDQTSAVVRTTTEGDSYAPIAVALEIDVKSPNFGSSTTAADSSLAQIGDTFTVTATITNTGQAQATNMAFSLALDPGLTLDAYTTDGAPGDIGGGAVTANDLSNGVAAGDLDINETRTITLTVTVTGAPSSGTAFRFEPEWAHSFVTCDGDPAIDESFTAPETDVPFQGENPTGSGGAGGSMGSAAGGDDSGAGPTGAGGAGNNGNDGDDIDEEGGCGCTTIGHEPAGTLSVTAFMFAGLLLTRRRRRAPRS